MTESDAVRHAEAARGRHGVHAGWALHFAERRYVAIGGPNADEPAPVRDVLAWVVRFGDELSFVDLAIEDRSGVVVRVERSR